jgi:hypothetical protein
VGKLHVLGGAAAFDQRRNTSMVKPVDPNVVPQFIRMCADARARGEPWIQWIDDGCPELTQEEYERVSTFKRRARG